MSLIYWLSISNISVFVWERLQDRKSPPTHYCRSMEVRGQMSGVGPLLPLCGSGTQNLIDGQARQSSWWLLFKKFFIYITQAYGWNSVRELNYFYRKRQVLGIRISGVLHPYLKTNTGPFCWEDPQVPTAALACLSVRRGLSWSPGRLLYGAPHERIHSNCCLFPRVLSLST